MPTTGNKHYVKDLATICSTHYTLFTGVAIRTPEGVSRGHPYIKISPNRKDWSHHQGLVIPCSYWTLVWFLLHPTRTKWVKALWDGTCAFWSLSEKTRKSNHLQMIVITIQRQHGFLLSYFKILSTKFWSGWGLNLWPPAQQNGVLLTDLTRQQFQLDHAKT